MPLARIIRLRSSAVSLNREAHRSRQKLQEMQRDRQAGIAQPEVEIPDSQPDAPPDRPAVEKAIALIETARDPIRSADKNKNRGKYGGLTWSQAYQKRLAVQSMAKTAKRRQAEHAARAGEQIAATPMEAAPAA
ncbi:hypothetical protein [Rhodopila sp.]|uniref:hypothetical protein n=1 Tax=Rhodopila sp. TaxID=2480087 RepID=UPI003D132B92